VQEWLCSAAGSGRTLAGIRAQSVPMHLQYPLCKIVFQCFTLLIPFILEGFYLFFKEVFDLTCEFDFGFARGAVVVRVTVGALRACVGSGGCWWE